MPGDIVFLAVNASYSHSSLASWYLQEVAVAAGWRWTEIELTLKDDPHAALAAADRLAPRVLAATFYLFNRDPVLGFVRRLKALRPLCIVIGGGPEFMGDNERFVRREPAVDVVVRGEGETAFRRFLENADAPEKWPAIPGLCGIRDGKYFDAGSGEQTASLDEVASPYERHIGVFRKPFVQMETSRGCSNTCSFCCSAGFGVRYFSMERVRRDLESVQRLGVQGVRLVDRTFNENPARCAELVGVFRKEYPGLRFHLEIDPARIGSSLLRELAKAEPARFHVEAGIQSLNPTVYRKVGRRATVKRSVAGLEALCRLGNLDVHADLLAGLPGSDSAQLAGDIRRLVAIRPTEIQLEVLKLLPGTALARDREQYGLVAAPEPPYEILSTPQMTSADLNGAREFSKLLDWFHNASALQEAVHTANQLLPDFWEALHAFCRPLTDFGPCPGLEERFRMLDRFLADRCAPARQRLHFAWMKHGFSPRRGICRAQPRRGPLPVNAVLVEGDADAGVAREYSVRLDGEYVFRYSDRNGDRRATAVFRLG